VDALVFEFMGLAMIGLCVIALAVPSARRPSGRVRHYWSQSAPQASTGKRVAVALAQRKVTIRPKCKGRI